MDNRQGTNRQQVKKTQQRKKAHADVTSVRLDIPKTEPFTEYGCPPSSMYIVEDGKVIKKCQRFSSVYRRIVRQHPQAIMLNVTVHRPSDSKRAELQCHRRIMREVNAGDYDFVLDDESLSAVSYDSTKKVNPRATPLNIESGFIGYLIEAGTDLISTDGPSGLVYDESTHDNRLATNEESAFMTVSIGNIAKKTFDTRKRMPKPVAAWLRQQAKELAERLNAAADEVEQIIDDRNLSLIRRFVAADPDVKFSDRHGLVDSTKPLPEPRWKPRTPIYRKIMGEAAADALENE